MMWSFVFIKGGYSTDLDSVGSFPEQRLVNRACNAVIFLIFIIPGEKKLLSR